MAFCINCGTQLDDESLFCAHCGTKVGEITEATAQETPVQMANPYTPPPVQPAVWQQIPQKPTGDRLLRHGFTSFVLWVNLILNVIAGICFILIIIVCRDDLADFAMEYNLENAFSVFLLAGWCVLNAYSFYKIIKWKKDGFYWLMVINFVASLGNVLNMGIIYTLIINGIGVLIIFGVLHIHNSYNAQTTWEQLD
jgi:hypothetical protein